MIALLGKLLVENVSIDKRIAPDMKSKRTIDDVVALYGEDAGCRLAPYLAKAGFATIPEKLALLAFKQEQQVEMWGYAKRSWSLIKTYPFTATSGRLGPKLREGDRQIPEGIYRIIFLHPNSSYHLSLKINYPNAFDKAMARQEGRSNPGGEIFFHGKAATIGCIPLGDQAIEEIFVLVSRVGKTHVEVIIAPVDFRQGKAKPDIQGIMWEHRLYDQIEQSLQPFVHVR